MEGVLNLLTVVLVLPFLLAALVCIVHPRWGAELLKRAMVLLVVGSVGICLLASTLRWLEENPLVIGCLMLGTVTAAFLIRESLRTGSHKPAGRPAGVERLPVVPRDVEGPHDFENDFQ